LIFWELLRSSPKLDLVSPKIGRPPRYPGYPAGCKDCNDVLKQYGQAELKAVLENAKPFPVEGIVNPSSLTDIVLHEYSQGVQGGEKTGWANRDEYYTVRPGELTIVTGVPGSGKSNFVDALAVNLIKSHMWRFGFFSPENWPLQRHAQTLIEKFLAQVFDSDAGLIVVSISYDF